MKRAALVLLSVCACAQSRAQPSTLPAQPMGQAEAAVAASRVEPPGAVPAQNEAPLPIGAVRLGGDIAALHAGRPVAFALHSGDVAGLSDDLAAVHPELRVVGDAVLVERGQLTSEVLERHREPSFLVDFDSEEIAGIARELPADASLAAMRAAVGARFKKRVYGDVWTASRAVRLQSGDCTEMAVVAAALARRLGKPARVVLGYVALPTKEDGIALGHAWTQVHDGGVWVDFDATPLGDEQRYYVILGELQNEAANYALSLLSAMGKLRASSIDIVALP